METEDKATMSKSREGLIKVMEMTNRLADSKTEDIDRVMNFAMTHAADETVEAQMIPSLHQLANMIKERRSNTREKIEGIEGDEEVKDIMMQFIDNPRQLFDNLDGLIDYVQQEAPKRFPEDSVVIVNRIAEWVKSMTLLGLVRSALAILEYIKPQIQERSISFLDELQETWKIPRHVIDMRAQFQNSFPDGSQESESLWTILNLLSSQSELFNHIDDDMFESIMEEVLDMIPLLMEATDGDFSQLADNFQNMI